MCRKALPFRVALLAFCCSAACIRGRAAPDLGEASAARQSRRRTSGGTAAIKQAARTCVDTNG